MGTFFAVYILSSSFVGAQEGLGDSSDVAVEDSATSGQDVISESNDVGPLSFGISGSLKLDNLRPGMSFDHQVVVSRSGYDGEMDVTIELESEEISEWMSFRPSNQFVFPAGEGQFPVTVSVNIPEDAEFGVYNGKVTFQAQAKSADTGTMGVAINVGAALLAELTVGDSVFSDYYVRSVDFLDILQNEETQVKVAIVNNGNVPDGPDDISFQLFDRFGDLSLGFSQEDNAFEKIAPFNKGEQVVSFPINTKGLTPGQYRGKVRVYGDSKQVYESNKVIFRINESGISSIPSILWLVLGGIGLLILISFIFWLIIGKKKKRRHRNKRRLIPNRK